MEDLKDKLFPREKSWVAETYKSIEEAFLVTEYFAKYLKKYLPSQVRTSSRGHLYLEYIDVVFCSTEKVPRKVLKLNYASNILQVLLPNRGYTLEEMEDLRDHYQQKYAPILKESHARTNAFLWRTFSEEERNGILRLCDENSQSNHKIKKEILEEITKKIWGTGPAPATPARRSSSYKKSKDEKK